MWGRRALDSKRNTVNTAYTIFMPVKNKRPLFMNIDPGLLAKIERLRFKRMFATRSEAIEFLLNTGLKAKPAELAAPKGK